MDCQAIKVTATILVITIPFVVIVNEFIEDSNSPILKIIFSTQYYYYFSQIIIVHINFNWEQTVVVIVIRPFNFVIATQPNLINICSSIISTKLAAAIQSFITIAMNLSTLSSFQPFTYFDEYSKDFLNLKSELLQMDFNQPAINSLFAIMD